MVVTSLFGMIIGLEMVCLEIFSQGFFALEGNKLATVNSKIEDEGLINSFRRHPRSGVWGLEGSGDFTVASIRMEIDDKRFLYVNSTTRWIKTIPIKVNIFAWKVKIDALPTRLNISRRGITLDSILCPICDCGAESTNHLFFECSLAGHLARLISKWWDTPYAEGFVVKPRLVGTTGLKPHILLLFNLAPC
ncbi:RNA-directed DNA polymerase, eukaryota [Tanacetum coccineum]